MWILSALPHGLLAVVCFAVFFGIERDPYWAAWGVINLFIALTFAGLYWTVRRSW